MVRSSPIIQGIVTPCLEHEISLYADNVIFFLSNPSQSLVTLAGVLTDYGSVAGYKTSEENSILMGLSLPSEI